MTATKNFIDTNVLFYLLSSDSVKADKAEGLLAEGGIVSVQVLNEFAAVAVRKMGMKLPEIRSILSVIRTACQVIPVSLQLHDDGMSIAERYGYSIFDSLIIAAALQANSEFLYSEDLHDGQSIGTLTIANPFKGV